MNKAEAWTSVGEDAEHRTASMASVRVLDDLWLEATQRTSGKESVPAFAKVYRGKPKAEEGDVFALGDEPADAPSGTGGDEPPVLPPDSSFRQPGGDGEHAPEPKPADEWGIPRVTLTDRNREHILGGEHGISERGGHRSGTGRESKSEFPADWSDDTIIASVEAAESNPQFVFRIGDRTIRRREVDSVIVEVSPFPRGDQDVLRAAFPVNGRGVIENQHGMHIDRPLDRVALAKYDWRSDDDGS